MFRSLAVKSFSSFIKTNNQFIRRNNPKTLKDVKKLESFVRKNKNSGQLETYISREARHNKEFNQFFDEFKEQNKGKWRSIVNGTTMNKELLDQVEELKNEDHLKAMYNFAQRKAAGLATGEENSASTTDIPSEEEDLTVSQEIKDKNLLDPLSALMPDRDLGEIFDPEDFHLIFLDTDINSNTGRLGRTYSRRILMFMGNCKGICSYAVGKAPTYQEAYSRCFEDLKKNLIAIYLDEDHTFPVDRRIRFNDYQMNVYSRMIPKYWGSPVILLMFKFAGCLHIEFDTIGRSKSPYSVVYTFMRIITQNVTIKQLFENFGDKRYGLVHSVPMKNALPFMRYDNHNGPI